MEHFNLWLGWYAMLFVGPAVLIMLVMKDLIQGRRQLAQPRRIPHGGSRRVGRTLW